MRRATQTVLGRSDGRNDNVVPNFSNVMKVLRECTHSMIRTFLHRFVLRYLLPLPRTRWLCMVIRDRYSNWSNCCSENANSLEARSAQTASATISTTGRTAASSSRSFSAGVIIVEWLESAFLNRVFMFRGCYVVTTWRIGH
jgi:hypothetical protein